MLERDLNQATPNELRTRSPSSAIAILPRTYASWSAPITSVLRAPSKALSMRAALARTRSTNGRTPVCQNADTEKEGPISAFGHGFISQQVRDTPAADGETIISAPVDQPFGRTFTFADPDGCALTLCDKA